MFYYVGNEADLKEKILSIPHHCSNSHQFPNNNHHLACSHGDLSEDERQKPWLEEGSKVCILMSENKELLMTSLIIS